MQAEGYVPVCVVGQPDAGVQGDDLGSAHQDDVHNEGESLMLCWGVHVVAVLAYYTDGHILPNTTRLLLRAWAVHSAHAHTPAVASQEAARYMANSELNNCSRTGGRSNAS